MEACPDGTFDENFHCLDCPDECELCTALDTCTACTDSFFLLDGTCTQDCQTAKYGDSADRLCKGCINECNDCDNGDVCVQCITDRFVSTAGLCVAECESD